MSDGIYAEVWETGAFLPKGRPSGKNVFSKGKSAVKDKKLFILKVIVLILCILLLVELVLYTFVIPSLVPAKISFSGLRTIPESIVRQKIQEVDTLTWMQFDTAKAVNSLSTISGIEKVTVDKHFPDKVEIQIKERVAVAKTIVFQNGHCQTVQIDENGVLFSSAAASVAKDSSIPLVTGLPIENAGEGVRLAARYRILMEQISYIRSLPQKYFAAISEIQVVPKEYGNYDLVLYPVSSRVRVLTDRSLNEDALKYMMVALDIVNSIDSAAGEIDLRYGAVSYRRR